jgi:GNAT superfamily N-acetyltransferase
MEKEIVIKKIETGAELNQFINFPHELYKEDPIYVPMLQMAARELLSKKKNPFFLHSEADNFIAYKNGKVVGRISAVRNNNYNKFHGSNVGFWGFYDVIDDFDVSKALFDTVVEWNKKHGFESIIGPVNYTTNDSAAVLVDGFNLPPMIEMTYNKPYYAEHIEKYGFKNEMDLNAFMITRTKVSERTLRLSDLISQRLNKRGITIRCINMKDFTNEVKKIKDVYNKAWEKNWGFVPATDEEFDVLAKNFKTIINPAMVLIAEHEGKFVGFSMAAPNVHEITINFKNGKLFPFNVFKLLMKKNKTRYFRIITLGVIEKYRRSGIAEAFYSYYINFAEEKNYIGAEASWILANNAEMNNGIERLNGEKYKTYRIYSIMI